MKFYRGFNQVCGLKEGTEIELVVAKSQNYLITSFKGLSRLVTNGTGRQ